MTGRPSGGQAASAVRPRPSAMTARTMVAACTLCSRSEMKERSILILSKGNACRFESEE